MLATVVSVDTDNGIALLSNKCMIHVVSGKEIGKEDIYWMPVAYDEEEVNIKRKAGQARTWLRKMMRVDEIAIAIYLEMTKKMDRNTKMYYHTISKESKQKMEDVSIGYIRRMFRQPQWCLNEDALSGPFGCFHLISGKVRKPLQCVLCPYFRRVQSFNLSKIRTVFGLTKQFMNIILGIHDYDNLETGERQPTRDEIVGLETIFNINEWTIRDSITYRMMLAKEDTSAKQMYKTFGKKIQYHISTKTIQDEKKKFKF